MPLIHLASGDVQWRDAADAADAASDTEADDHLLPQIMFPDLEPGYYDEFSGRWRKPASAAEQHVYMTVRHPRILRYYGTRDGELELEFHRNGDLWTYLVQREPSLTTRVQWAVQIAEGLAALHSHSIVWADGHFRNILVTTNLNVVLCDFAYSLSSPQQFTVLSTAPPPVFVAPYGYFGRDPVYFDIFAYGVMLFALLSNRFPWTCDLRADWETQRRALEKHGSRQFDSLEVAELNTHFGRVVEQCFRATYRSGTELLGDISKARDSWLKFTL